MILHVFEYYGCVLLFCGSERMVRVHKCLALTFELTVSFY